MRKHLTNFDLKVIAIFTMTIDHMGYFLFPQYDWLRMIGRIAFPLFAFLCAESFRYTKDRKMYVLRMLFCGAIYTLIRFYFEPYGTGDIFLTLGFGFLILWGIEEKQYWLSIIAFLSGMLIPVDYYAYGMLMIPVMYYLKDRKIALLFVVMLMNVGIVLSGNSSPLQYYSILSIFLIWLYNNQVGYKKGKYFFYVYYPVHVVILAVLSWL